MKMNITKDYLPSKPDVTLYQDKNMFCLNSDTVALGEFIKVHHKDVVLDIGTNQGALLLYASFFKPRRLIGIDINSAALELAKRNLITNGVENFTLLSCDIRAYRAESVDVIICNPPYFPSVSDDKAQNEYLNLAKHTDLTMKELIAAISCNLKANGSLFIVYQAKMTLNLLHELQCQKIEPKVMKFIYDENKSSAHAVLIKATKGQKPGLSVEKPIIIKR